MICVAVSVNHYACAQPDQATNSMRSSANASALLKHTVAIGDSTIESGTSFEVKTHVTPFSTKKN